MHSHDDTDELFLATHGELTIQVREGDVTLQPGQLFVVPRGVEHCPIADGEAHAVLIEPPGVINTGAAGVPSPPPTTTRFCRYRWQWRTDRRSPSRYTRSDGPPSPRRRGRGQGTRTMSIDTCSFLLVRPSHHPVVGSLTRST